LLVTDDELICAGGDQARWKTPLPHGPLAGVPLLDGESFLLASSNGVVYRIEAETGKAVGNTNVGLPLQNGPVLLGDRLLVAGHDGTLYQIQKP
jgi:outer membrane protein assembly factor BamB